MLQPWLRTSHSDAEHTVSATNRTTATVTSIGLLALAIAVSLFACYLVPVAAKQTKYLTANGLQSEESELRHALLSRIDRAGLSWTGMSAEEVAAWWAFRMAINGTTVSDLQALEAEGFDFAKAIHPSRAVIIPASFRLQTTLLINDLVVIAEVEDAELTPEAPYGSVVHVRVNEVLKGRAESRSISVVQRSGRTPEGYFTDFEGDLPVLGPNGAVEGSRFVLYLSSGMYRFRYGGANSGRPFYSLSHHDSISKDGEVDVLKKYRERIAGARGEIGSLGSASMTVESKSLSEMSRQELVRRRARRVLKREREGYYFTDSEAYLDSIRQKGKLMKSAN